MRAFKLLFIFILLKNVAASSKPCQARTFKTGIVCVCNDTYCDTLEPRLPKNDGDVLILSTSKNGLRFHETKTRFGALKVTIPNGVYHYGSQKNPNIEMVKQIFKIPDRFEEPLESIVNIDINRTATFQKIIGFGGAFTGAVSHNLKELSSSKLQNYVYESYYSKQKGNGYNLMRFPIGGCDFDVEPWAYNEFPEHDPYLTGFKQLDKRDIEKIEQVNQLKKVTGNHDIKIIGAAWSPPRWMKTNGEWSGFSALRDEYYQTWADYHVKYLELMHDNNFSFWGVSTGNEPLNGVVLPMFVKFMSLGWMPKEQGKWVGENFGPAMKSSSKTSQIKILAGDDQRLSFPWWFDMMYEAQPDVSQYIDGLAVHWYADKFTGPNPLDEASAKFPGKFIMNTEACSGDRPWDVHKPILGFWGRCEDYVIDIIEDLNHHVSAWIDWNLILDEEGGPNYADNNVDSPIVANESEIYKQPTFYAMGHFSRFILPDSTRVFAKSSHKFIKSTGFLRPDGYLTIVFYNFADHNLDVNIFDKIHGVLRLEVPAKSIHTVIYK